MKKQSKLTTLTIIAIAVFIFMYIIYQFHTL
jgi:hypothetical protein